MLGEAGPREEAETRSARTHRRGHSIACPRWAIAKVAPRASRHVSQAPRHERAPRHPPPDIQIPAPTAGRYVRRIGLAPLGWSPFCPSVQARGLSSGPQRPRRRSGNGLDAEGYRSPKPLSGTCGSIASPIGGSTNFCAGTTGRVQIQKERIKSPPPHSATTWSGPFISRARDSCTAVKHAIRLPRRRERAASTAQ